MADLNDEGSIRVRCPGCEGSLSSYEWHTGNKEHGAVRSRTHRSARFGDSAIEYRLFRCAGCGRGGLGVFNVDAGNTYPVAVTDLRSFYPEVVQRLALPVSVPAGIAAEFREGESCLDAKCYRAAAGMFRSVLDKTMRANGYKLKAGTNLEQQIDMAAADGVITAARKKRAHDEIRVLGNDVLHEEWRKIKAEDVELARHYAQRILEDLYDDRTSVLALLRAANRVADEDKLQADAAVALSPSADAPR
jgi:hypothetical protein